MVLKSSQQNYFFCVEQFSIFELLSRFFDNFGEKFEAEPLRKYLLEEDLNWVSFGAFSSMISGTLFISDFWANAKASDSIFCIFSEIRLICSSFWMAIGTDGFKLLVNFYVSLLYLSSQMCTCLTEPFKTLFSGLRKIWFNYWRFVSSSWFLLNSINNYKLIFIFKLSNLV